MACIGWEVFSENPELAVSIFAGIIALSALALSIWEGLSNRKHNRLLVKPLAGIKVDFATREENGNFSISVKAHNKGLGPAIINKIALHHASLEDGELVYCFSSLFEKVRPSLLEQGEIFTVEKTDDSFLVAQGEEITLLSIEFPNTDEGVQLISDCVVILQDTVGKVYYSSIYGENNSFDFKLSSIFPDSLWRG